jgi:hypothetical protein
VVNFIEGISKYGNPIVKKYREGKMKRTLKRELKLPETAEKEAVGTVTISFGGTVAVPPQIGIDLSGSNCQLGPAWLLDSSKWYQLVALVVWSYHTVTSHTGCIRRFPERLAVKAYGRGKIPWYFTVSAAG